MLSHMTNKRATDDIRGKSAHRTLEYMQNELAMLDAENKRLKAEIGGFTHLADLRQAMLDTADENARLTLKVAALQRHADRLEEWKDVALADHQDAERYRWLRDGSYPSEFEKVTAQDTDKWDAAIDSAIATPDT
jgi:hypothetical protein